MAVPTELTTCWHTRPDDVPDRLRNALTTCWRDVANNGGAVGFAELLPVSDDDVRPVVDQIVAEMDPQGSRLLTVRRGEALAGWLRLTLNTNPVTAHWGRVTSLQTSVEARGTGMARAPMTALHRSAREDLGLDSLRLEVRGGWGLEPFYEKFGWVVVCAWPGALQFTEHGRRDEVLMARDLRSEGRAA